MSHSKKKMISFFVTTKCNLDCIYCYANKDRNTHKSQSIDFNFAKLGIDYFFKNYNSRHIRFFGSGEPTLELNLIKKINSYAKEKSNSLVTSEIQTNGTFNDNTRDWLAENVDIIWVSFDGPPEIQNYYRPFFKTGKPTSSILERNVRFLAVQGSGMTGARVTINKLNINKQIEMINYFRDLGIKYIWTDPLFPSVGYRPISNDLEAKDIKPAIDLDEYIENFIKAYEHAVNNNIFYGSFLGCNFDEKTNTHCRACDPMPHLTTDGYISACDMAMFGENPLHMDVFIYGKWNKQNNKLEFYEDKISQLKSRNLSNLTLCKSCEISENCGGYCLGEVVNETGSLFGKKGYTCKAIRKLSKHIPLNTGCFDYLHP